MKQKADNDGRKKIKLKDDENKDELGRFKKGNKLGYMLKSGFTLSDLNKLVLEYERSPENKRGPLLKHYVKRLFKNDKLLAKYLDKNIATKSINELTGLDGGPLNITLNELIYGKETGKSQKENNKDPETPVK